jgi:hypothetical protein
MPPKPNLSGPFREAWFGPPHYDAGYVLIKHRPFRRLRRKTENKWAQLLVNPGVKRMPFGR